MADDLKGRGAQGRSRGKCERGSRSSLVDTEVGRFPGTVGRRGAEGGISVHAVRAGTVASDRSATGQAYQKPSRTSSTVLAAIAAPLVPLSDACQYDIGVTGHAESEREKGKDRDWAAAAVVAHLPSKQAER
jgi:hypothetical protein